MPRAGSAFVQIFLAVLPHKFVLRTGQRVVENAAKLWVPVFSPFVAPHSAPPHRNHFDFLPTTIRPNMLDEEKSSQQEKEYEIYAFTKLEAQNKDVGI